MDNSNVWLSGPRFSFAVPVAVAVAVVEWCCPTQYNSKCSIRKRSAN